MAGNACEDSFPRGFFRGLGFNVQTEDIRACGVLMMGLYYLGVLGGPNPYDWLGPVCWPNPSQDCGRVGGLGVSGFRGVLGGFRGGLGSEFRV